VAHGLESNNLILYFVEIEATTNYSIAFPVAAIGAVIDAVVADVERCEEDKTFSVYLLFHLMGSFKKEALYFWFIALK